MEEQITKACGLDVHQASVTACILRQGYKRQIRTFGTMTSDLLSLKQWLEEESITHVAMESTGVYWKPVMNVLGSNFNVIVANARHIKNVPGRKTDVKDCEWICQLLRSGLLQGSFIPPPEFRQLRELTRYSKKLRQEITQYKNKVHKLLQDANIKITSVLSDVHGITGSRILQALAAGTTDAETLSKFLLCNKKLAAKMEVAKEALTGCFQPHHRYLLQTFLHQMALLEQGMEKIQEEIQRVLLPYCNQYQLLQTIPGIKSKAAAIIMAEIGVDMSSFPTARHLASWAGLCPGNNESAGKKKSSRITPGNNYLKAGLIECAWATVLVKDTYLRAKYYQLCSRMGSKKAQVAIAHKLLKACWYILKYQVPYKDIGEPYLPKDKQERITKHYIKKLQQMGYEVNLHAAE